MKLKVSILLMSCQPNIVVASCKVCQEPCSVPHCERKAIFKEPQWCDDSEHLFITKVLTVKYIKTIINILLNSSL